MVKLCVILGDQLSMRLSSLSRVSKNDDIILMCEVSDEANYVKHHKKKIAFLFCAMRHHAQHLKTQGFKVRYIKLDDPNNTGSFKKEVERAIAALPVDELIVTEPGEYRVLKDIQSWEKAFHIKVHILPDKRFYMTPAAFAKWAKGRKELRMEHFYREMRRQHNILMNGKDPEGGQWNYDNQNRKKLPKQMTLPKPHLQHREDDITKEVLALIESRFSDHFGDLNPFYFAVTRTQALAVLEKFFKERLEFFGDYQDAMKEGEPWLYHSHISFYLNCGLLDPDEVVQGAIDRYYQGRMPLNAVEGFIRQIIGWREYIRGVYWLKMPEYTTLNYLSAKRPLPDFYWSGQTKMNCIKQCVIQTKEYAYAHHIQRLMVLGNFALLTGIDPFYVNEWYLIVYADAYEWVEMPNVSGMILYADGGALASKPYAAGGAYINRMSDYCSRCAYKVKEKSGNTACPFNYLYWNFLISNRAKLEGNARLSIMYKNLDKMEVSTIQDITDDAEKFLDSL